jgi:PhnB protein
MTTKPIPDGYHTVTPYLMINDCAKAIEFYKKAFGATELVRMPMPDGRIGHAEIKIGDSPIMMADDCPQGTARSPKTLSGTSIGIALYVENSDAVFARAVEAGATVVKPMENQFYGDRSGTVLDPFGHLWTIGTHVEDVSPEEMERRMEAMKNTK